MMLPEMNSGVLRDLLFPPGVENTYLQLGYTKTLSINSEIEVVLGIWGFR